MCVTHLGSSPFRHHELCVCVCLRLPVGACVSVCVSLEKGKKECVIAKRNCVCDSKLDVLGP